MPLRREPPPATTQRCLRYAATATAAIVLAAALITTLVLRLPALRVLSSSPSPTPPRSVLAVAELPPLDPSCDPSTIRRLLVQHPSGGPVLIRGFTRQCAPHLDSWASLGGLAMRAHHPLINIRRRRTQQSGGTFVPYDASRPWSAAVPRAEEEEWVDSMSLAAFAELAEVNGRSSGGGGSSRSSHHHYVYGQVDRHLGSVLHRETQPLVDIANGYGSDGDGSSGEDCTTASFFLSSGAAGTGAATHYDALHNFYVQLAGRKRWRIWSPAHIRALCFHPALDPRAAVSKILGDAPADNIDGGSGSGSGGSSISGSSSGSSFSGSPSVCPTASGARSTVAVIEPGDLLYVPPYHPHRVTALSPASVSIYSWSAVRVDAAVQALEAEPDFTPFAGGQDRDFAEGVAGLLVYIKLALERAARVSGSAATLHGRYSGGGSVEAVVQHAVLSTPTMVTNLRAVCREAWPAPPSELVPPDTMRLLKQFVSRLKAVPGLMVGAEAGISSREGTRASLSRRAVRDVLVSDHVERIVVRAFGAFAAAAFFKECLGKLDTEKRKNDPKPV